MVPDKQYIQFRFRAGQAMKRHFDANPHLLNGLSRRQKLSVCLQANSAIIIYMSMKDERELYRMTNEQIDKFVEEALAA